MKQSVVLSVVIIVLLSTLSCASAATTAEHQSAFTTWMHTHGKSYTAADFISKFEAFISNMEFVLAHNARTDTTHKVELNHFADMNTKEWADTYLNKRIGQQITTRADGMFTGEGQHVRATTVDWRGIAVTPIKDQKQCGSCWTFASAAGVESAYYFSTGQLLSLSEQNMLDCVSASYDCNGGDTQQALKWVQTNGIELETDYPYTGTKGSCLYTAAKKAAGVTSVIAVTSGSESALQAAVTNQPVTIAIDANHQSFQLYSGGIYSEPACGSALNQLDHAVLAVGYSTNASGDYWIIKNSWGTTWGDKGWLYLARNANNMCGVATYTYYATRTSTSSTTTTSAKAATTSGAATTSTTTKSTTGTSTTAKTSTSTTGSASTTGSSTKYIFQDSLAAGWTLTYSATVTGVSTTLAGYSGSGVTATMPVSSTLTFTDSTAVPMTTLVFYVKSSVATTLSIGLAGYNPITVQSVAGSWNIWTLNLAGVSESGVVFTNTGAAATIYMDNISYS